MTWDYLPVLNKLLQILVTIAIGTGAGAFGVLSADDFVPAAVRFVFYVALPCLITKGIGTCCLQQSSVSFRERNEVLTRISAATCRHWN